MASFDHSHKHTARHPRKNIWTLASVDLVCRHHYHWIAKHMQVQEGQPPPSQQIDDEEETGEEKEEAHDQEEEVY
jgi:hypothetical protein